MDLKQTMAELERLGSEQTRKTMKAHGSSGDFFGVKVADLKTVLKKIKGRQDLALELYDTGNLDAMYLAGLAVDGSKMTRQELQRWVEKARSAMICEYAVPWVAAESPHARELALRWMDSPRECVAAAGWNTYSGIVSLTADDRLDLDEIRSLLARVEREIGKAPNRARYCMNGFVIAVGGSVTPLAAAARATARRLGTVEVDMRGTACKVPSALAAIEKIAAMGRTGKKRKTMKC